MIPFKIRITEEDDGFFVDVIFEDGTLWHRVGTFETKSSAILARDDLVEMVIGLGGRVTGIETNSLH